MTTTIQLSDFLAILKRLSKSAGFAARGNGHGDQRSKMTDVLPFKQAKLTIFSLRVFPILYLATPFQEFPGGLQRAYEEACKLGGRMAKNGVRVYSPISHCFGISFFGDINPIDNPFWLEYAKPMIRLLPALVVGELESWKKSNGIKGEIEDFEKAGKPVYYINPNSLEVRQ